MKNMFKPLAFAAAILLAPTATLAEDWTPLGPITMMIGFAAGGGADT